MAENVHILTPAVRDRVQDLIEEVLAETPYFLIDLEVRGARGARAVNVFVDSDGGVGVDELARLSRDVAFLLDAEEALEGRYTLRVSSPGVDRPLLLPRQYKKHVGRTLRVAYHPSEGGEEDTFTGELLAVEEEAVVLAGKPEAPRRIPFDQIQRAHVVLPW